MPRTNEIAIVGAGVAGLTAAALLAKGGASVTLYEHHTIAGGCASFYQREGFRFDVGATVVNGFGPRGAHRRVFALLGIDVPAERLDPAMVVHVCRERIVRYGDERWRAERIRAFGSALEPFWERQERNADRAWDFAARFPALPVDVTSLAHLLGTLRLRHLPLIGLQGRTLASWIPHDAPLALRTFLDAQLLITAQSDLQNTDASFACTALDIAREGTYHLPGGIADIAIALARSVRRNGGSIRYGTDVRRIRTANGRVVGLELADGSTPHFERVIAAIPYENVCALLGESVRAQARNGQKWSAVTAHVGLAPGVIADESVLHHQVVFDEHRALGEGNSAFVSISGAGDRSRARNGGRAITISTHTDPARWENAQRLGTLDTLKREYATALLRALERVVGRAVDPMVFELGTPFTFERYTARYRGMVGGVPQTTKAANLLARSHRSHVRGLLLCGDTIFPGQSTVGVTLSAINAVRALGGPVPTTKDD